MFYRKYVRSDTNFKYLAKEFNDDINLLGNRTRLIDKLIKECSSVHQESALLIFYETMELVNILATKQKVTRKGFFG